MDVQILEKFHKCLVLFFDELIEMFPDEKEFIILRILVKDQIPSTQIMSYFEYVHNSKEFMISIQKRDDEFFLQNVLFSKFSKSEVFKNLWKNNLDDENKNMIWTWIDAFMKMTKSYIEIK